MRLTAVLVLSLASTCFGWGGIGHQAIAIIAEDHLTPAAKAGIQELIGEANISDAEICSWADEVRRERRATAPWHYVNIPTTAPAFDRKRDGNYGDNIIDAITNHAKLLADKSAPKEKRQEALKFVVHFVGDIHQPLHCADRNGDKVGNKRLVFWLERKTAVSLHTVWDTHLVTEAMAKRRVLDYARALDAKITEKQRAEWAKGTPEQWANETFCAAVAHAYASVPADGPPPKLGSEYVTKNVPLIDEQIQRAGVRLAYVLNSAFAAGR